jgi:hypothetical protein
MLDLELIVVSQEKKYIIDCELQRIPGTCGGTRRRSTTILSLLVKNNASILRVDTWFPSHCNTITNVFMFNG